MPNLNRKPVVKEKLVPERNAYLRATPSVKADYELAREYIMANAPLPRGVGKSITGSAKISLSIYDMFKASKMSRKHLAKGVFFLSPRSTDRILDPTYANRHTDLVYFGEKLKKAVEAQKAS